MHRAWGKAGQTRVRKGHFFTGWGKFQCPYAPHADPCIYTPVQVHALSLDIAKGRIDMEDLSMQLKRCQRVSTVAPQPGLCAALLPSMRGPWS